MIWLSASLYSTCTVCTVNVCRSQVLLAKEIYVSDFIISFEFKQDD